MDELRSLEDLLDLHGIDRQIDRLLERRGGLPELEDYRSAHESLQLLNKERDEWSDRLRDVSLDLDKGSGELSIIEDKANREESRLYAGGMSARDADYLRREVENLRARISQTEEKVLELMESRDAAEREVARLDGLVGEAGALKERLETSIRDQWRTIDVEVGAKESRKAEIAPLIDEELMELYEELRATRDGDVVGRLEAGICGACHLKLSAAEEARARKEDPPRCIHCRAILVP
jgi:uncharacterized protein